MNFSEIFGFIGLVLLVVFIVLRIERTNTCSGPQFWQDLNNGAYSRVEQTTSNAICRVREKLKETN